MMIDAYASTSLPYRARTLGERLLTAESQELSEDSRCDGTLAAWCEAAAQGDEETLRRRLAWDGLDIPRVRVALENREDPDLSADSAWLDLILEAVASPGDGAGWTGSRVPPDDNALPFEEVLAGFVQAGWRRVEPGACSALSAGTRSQIERALLRRLSAEAAQTLFLEFSLWRHGRTGGLAGLFGSASGGRLLYGEFVSRLRDGELFALFQRYPVLARLLGTTTLWWAEATSEMLGRLEADRPDLERELGGGHPLGALVSIELGQSDSHHHGRTVTFLSFEGGQKLVYKPRPLDIDVAYNHLCCWLNDHGAPLPFPVVPVIARVGYGWVSFVSAEPCRDAEEAQRFFRRAGMLLCLMHVLRASDLHFENLVAQGEWPVPVDLETLCFHDPVTLQAAQGGGAYAIAEERVARSVARIHLLPTWLTMENGGPVFDASALGRPGEGLEGLNRPGWRNINTDSMAPEQTAITAGVSPCIATLDGAPLDATEHRDEIVSGFTQMYRFFLHNQALVSHPDGPLSDFRHQQSRFIFRPTFVYAAILQQLQHPRYMGNGVDRSVHLEHLARAHIAAAPLAGGPPVTWPLLQAEIEAMEWGDIPYFRAPTTDTRIDLGDGRLVPGLPHASYDEIVETVAGLSETDLAWQSSVIRIALWRKREHAAGPWRVGADPNEPGATAAVEEALSLAEEILRAAIVHPDGSIAWIAPQLVGYGDRRRLSVAGFDLAEGAPGIALFLGALFRVTGVERYRAAALGAVQPLRAALDLRGHHALLTLPIGGPGGIGSTVYALTHLATLLPEPELLQLARRAALCITEKRVAAEHMADPADRMATAILYLMALYDMDPAEEILERACWCGNRLIESLADAAPDAAAGDRGGRHQMTAPALNRLYHATGERQYRDAELSGAGSRDDIAVSRSCGPSDYFDPTLCRGAADTGYDLLRRAFPDQVPVLLR